MKFLPLITAQQAAEILGVTDSRVRQMVGEGALRPVYRGGRSQLFWRAEIMAYLRRKDSSQVARSLPPASRPLRLVVDTVIQDPAPWTGDMITDKPLHVRIYRSDNDPAGTQESRTVVLLSEPVGRGLRVLINRIEQIVATVADRFLDGAIADAVWVDVWPPDHWSEHDVWTTGVRLSNILLHRNGSGHDADWSPTWSPMTIEELGQVLGGATVDWFEWNSYRPALINRWQRTGRPVEVIVDREGIQPVVEAYRQLQETSHPAAEAARRALLHRTAMLWSSAVRQRDMEKDYPLDLRASDDTERREANTSIRCDYVLPDDVLAALPNLADDETATLAETSRALAQLHAWLDDVDEWADEPAPRLAGAVGLAVEAQTSWDRMADPDRRDRPAQTRESYRITVELLDAPWDRQYADGIRWEDSDPRASSDLPLAERRQTRQLASEYAGSTRDWDLRFGHDFRGNWVLRATNTQAQRPLVFHRICWPTTYDAYPLPDAVDIVADGDSGDRPVYLARRGSLIGLLPRSREFEGWNFGYGGGGPGQLEADIERFLEAAGVRVEGAIASRIEAAIEESPEDALNVSVDQLISPYGR